MEKIKIYTVSDGKVHEAEARETKKSFIIESTSLYALGAFEFRTRFSKDEVNLSPLKAIESEMKRTQRKLQYAKLQIHNMNTELDQLKKLKKSLTNHP